MPFKSEAQRKWMYENNPAMAAEFEKETPKGKPLPPKSKHPLALKTRAKRDKSR
jgi:hypothetical protein